MPTRKLRVAMDEILDAMTVSETDPMRFYLDLETGKVDFTVQTEDFLDETDGEETK
jgi:hypothetical protein